MIRHLSLTTYNFLTIFLHNKMNLSKHNWKHLHIVVHFCFILIKLHFTETRSIHYVLSISVFLLHGVPRLRSGRLLRLLGVASGNFSRIAKRQYYNEKIAGADNTAKAVFQVFSTVTDPHPEPIRRRWPVP